MAAESRMGFLGAEWRENEEVLVREYKIPVMQDE